MEINELTETITSALSACSAVKYVTELAGKSTLRGGSHSPARNASISAARASASASPSSMSRVR
jgi:hypothetical protein